MTTICCTGVCAKYIQTDVLANTITIGINRGGGCGSSLIHNIFEP